MKVIETNLKDCYIIEPNKFGDERGYFSPYYIKSEYKEKGLDKIFGDIVQTNRSLSSKGTLRGLHYQKDPKCQAKLVEVINGKAIDVVVDLRINSETFKQATAVLLTKDNNRQLLVPRGFAHGFLSLEDNTIFQYLVDNDYAKDLEDGIFWDDDELEINWQEMFLKYGIDEPLLSIKDQQHKTLKRKLKDNEITFRR